MALTEAAERIIRGRRATRAFLAEAVPEETLRAVFELAGAAPSNSNVQPWRVEVVSGAAKDRLADALVDDDGRGRRTVDFPYSEAIYGPEHHQRRAAFGQALYGALGIDRDAREMLAAYNTASLRFYGAPHVALLFAPDSGDPRLTADVGMYAQTLLLAMQAHGVDSCPQALLSFYADTVRETLGVSGGKLLLGVAFGYADPAARVNTVAVGREPLEETTRFHR
ncbi:nitroreductase [Winogradskya consettensis]|uniref:Nitroreductase NfnB n=1 Tax=Winogradskya consettensis TaxID=113560 RepID=A0A919SE01_9ACTN|nr:nitroreductase [Actinoplanes consettensis]GIM70642.1 nitroreductase NfnB [Actinoplanes consettensis]